MAELAGRGATWGPAGCAEPAGADGTGLGAEGVVVSAMTLHVRSDQCRAHPSGTDHFAEAVITGTAVARFGRPKAAWPPSLTVLPLDAGGARQVR